MANTWDDIFNSWLEESEEGQRAQFYNSLTGARSTGPASFRGNNFQSYWEPQFNTMRSRYLGPYAEQIKKILGEGGSMEGSNIPTFGNWLSSYNFARDWQRLAPYQRGERPSTFAPNLRYSMYR